MIPTKDIILTPEDNARFSSLYEKYRVLVEAKIIESLSEREPKSLYQPCFYIMNSPGKRIRPLLVILSALAVGGKSEEVLNAALAVELLHNFTLVHDDIMDNAEKRRGNPTLHVKYNLSTAVLAGDALLAVAYEYLMRDALNKRSDIVTSFTKGLVEVCDGQSYDKDFEIQDVVSTSEYLTMIEKKTAALLIMCLSIGSKLGGGSDAEVEALEQYGKNIGIAFQIQDDLLDITANEAELGKMIGGDLVEGKKTFLFLKALEKAEGSDLDLLNKMVSDKGIKQSEIEVYKAIFVKLGVLDEARKEIEGYTFKALKNLDILQDENSKKVFIWLANLLLKRKK